MPDSEVIDAEAISERRHLISLAFRMLGTMAEAEGVRDAVPEIAETVGRTPLACRQLATSARRKLRECTDPAGLAGGA